MGEIHELIQNLNTDPAVPRLCTEVEKQAARAQVLTSPWVAAPQEIPRVPQQIAEASQAQVCPSEL